MHGKLVFEVVHYTGVQPSADDSHVNANQKVQMG